MYSGGKSGRLAGAFCERSLSTSPEWKDLRPGPRIKDLRPDSRAAEIEYRNSTRNGKRFNRLLFFVD